jgi:CRP/FNR family transcriptional regulator
LKIKELESHPTIRDIPLFSELTIEQLREISAISAIKKFVKHEFIFHEGDYYQGFFILLKGTVKIFKVTPAGKESVVHIVKPFNAFADIPLFEGSDYPVNAQAIEGSLALFIPKEGFLDLLKKNHEISLKMLAGFAKRLKSLVAQIEDLTSKEVVNRLAKYLVKEIKKSGTENLPEPFIKLTVPKSTIAAYLGTITETLSRTFKKLHDNGIIKVQGKKIFITDLSKLKKLGKD